MLHLLARYSRETGCPSIAVHVHHGLSSQADRWVQLCQTWCRAEDIPLNVRHVYLQRHGRESLEALARDARYRVLNDYVGVGDLLLTGHHSDDQLETFLLAVKRGSGPKGMSGMGEITPFGEGQLVRPLLSATRQAIEVYAHQYRLTWVEDESNQDTRFDRNFIRHEIAPVLKKRWPDFPQAIQRSATLCAQQELLLNELLQDVFARLIHHDDSLYISELLTLSPAAREHLLRMWFCHIGQPMPSRVQLAHLYRQVMLARQDADPILRLGNREIRRFDGRLFSIPVQEDIRSWHRAIGVNQVVRLPDQMGTLILKEVLGHGQISRDRLTESLWISFDPTGLSACPVGRQKHQKVKKLFQEYRIPSWQRRRLPILMNGHRVVCVANLFVDQSFVGTDYSLVWESLPDPA
jgi:tRNA(Ile)-lysidine synthase